MNALQGVRFKEEVRKREDIISARDLTISAAAGELGSQLATMRAQQDEAVAFESAERETMRLALTEIILQREATISDLCVSLGDTRAQARSRTLIALSGRQRSTMYRRLMRTASRIVSGR